MSMLDDSVVFQIIDWKGCHRTNGDEELYAIRMFGRTAEGKTVYLRVDGFTPYFYVEIPKQWDKLSIKLLITTATDKLKDKNNRYHLNTYDTVEKSVFWKFQC